MSPAHDPGALLARYYALPTGPRVRLRLVRRRDRDGIRDLFAERGRTLSELELARLVAGDIARRRVLVATTLIAIRETIVGVGAVELDADVKDPTVLARDPLGDGLEELLRDALIGHAATLVHARTA